MALERVILLSQSFSEQVKFGKKSKWEDSEVDGRVFKALEMVGKHRLYAEKTLCLGQSMRDSGIYLLMGKRLPDVEGQGKCIEEGNEIVTCFSISLYLGDRMSCQNIPNTYEQEAALREFLL